LSQLQCFGVRIDGESSIVTIDGLIEALDLLEGRAALDQRPA
jgi:hypothetical protein